MYNLLSGNLPEEKKKHMTDRVGDIDERISVLSKTDEKLDFIDDFNKRLAIFNASVNELEGWLTEARKRVDNIISPDSSFSPEDRVTKTMEFQEDLRKKIEFLAAQENTKEDIFPKPDEKIPSDAKKYIAHLDGLHKTIYAMDEVAPLTPQAEYSQLLSKVSILSPSPDNNLLGPKVENTR